jgi:hypothetical protein
LLAGYKVGAMSYKVQLDGDNLVPYLTGQVARNAGFDFAFQPSLDKKRILTGAVGHTTTTDPRSRRNRVGRRGGQLPNTRATFGPLV